MRWWTEFKTWLRLNKIMPVLAPQIGWGAGVFGGIAVTGWGKTGWGTDVFGGAYPQAGWGVI